MELSDLVQKFTEFLQISKIEEAPKRLFQILNGNPEKLFDEWIAFCPDLSKDYMQMIYQYYLADRKNLGQDYTPVCLGALLAELCGCCDGDTVTDMCSGSGSLTIQQWNKNRNLKFICKEYDENVIPFLLFNLSIRNIEAEVQRCDILSGEVSMVYKLTEGEKYSSIEKVTEFNENLYQ